MSVPFDPNSKFERKRLIAHVLLESSATTFEWDLSAHVLTGGRLIDFAALSGVSVRNLSRILRALAWRASFVLHPSISPFGALGVTDRPLLLDLLRDFDPIGKFHHRSVPPGTYEAVYAELAPNLRPRMWAKHLQRELFEATKRSLKEDLWVGLYVFEITSVWINRFLNGSYLAHRKKAPRPVLRILGDRIKRRERRRRRKIL